MSDKDSEIPEVITAFYNELTLRYMILKKENEKLRAVAEASRKYIDMYDVSGSCLGVMLRKALEALDE